MYIRFLSTEKSMWNGKDGYPSSLVLVWTMNDMSMSSGGSRIYGKPNAISEIRLASKDSYDASSWNALFNRLNFSMAMSPGESYGTIEEYAEGRIVNIETDRMYVYVCADSDHAIGIMKRAASELGLCY